MKIKNKVGLVVFCAILLVLQGCSSTPVKHASYGNTSTTQVSKIAKSMIGVQYRYGGRHPDTGFDCSGLVYYSHLRAGKTVPRTSQAQYRATTPVSKSSLREGDLVFFRIRRNRVSHVGIYLGNGHFVHAPSTGKKVSITSLNEPYWRKRFVRGGRVY
jgi:cell wall-associated NlpC family hydrolase